MKTYLITGVAGFIGQRVAELLLEEGHTVVGIDNLNHYYDVSLKQFRLDLLNRYKNFIFYKEDIENLEGLNQIAKKYEFSCLFNLSARAGVRYSMENPHVYITTNTHGCLNLLEICRIHKIKKFVLASTSSLYAGQEMPFLENLPVNEPISPYAASKKSAEAMSYTYHHLYGLDVSILRYFTVYGPYSRPDMAFMRFSLWIDKGEKIQLYGDGTQARDFTYVDDIAIGTISAQKKLGFEVINLGGGQNPISINEMINTIESKLGKKAKIAYLPFHKADMKDTWANISKAKKLLNWTPKTSFESGVEESLKHIEQIREFKLN